MPVIVVHDPRLTERIPDGAVFAAAGDAAALERIGVLTLPFEDRVLQYSRAGYGSGYEPPTMNLGSCPIIVDLDDGSFPYLYWTAYLVPKTGLAAAPMSGALALQVDSSRRVQHPGLMATTPRATVDSGTRIIRGRAKVAGTGLAGFNLNGYGQGFRIAILGVSVTRTDERFE